MKKVSKEQVNLVLIGIGIGIVTRKAVSLIKNAVEKHDAKLNEDLYDNDIINNDYLDNTNK